jgi:hypothetical protein
VSLACRQFDFPQIYPVISFSLTGQASRARNFGSLAALKLRFGMPLLIGAEDKQDACKFVTMHLA